MPVSLAKVHKKINKKRGNSNTLNENSRDSQRLRRAGMRDGKLARVLAARMKANQPMLQRVAYFQEAARDVTIPLSDESIHDLIKRYLRRDEEELDTLKAERRPGRPASSRQDTLSLRAATEAKEYDTGFYLPDLQDEKNLVMLTRWPGDWTYLPGVKFVRLSREGGRQDASFPPHGSA